MTNSTLIDFLLDSPHLPSEQALGDAVCQLAELAWPGSAVAVVANGQKVLASAGATEPQLDELIRGTRNWTAGPYPLGAGLNLYGMTEDNKPPANYKDVARIARAGVEHWRLEGARRIRRSWGGVTRAYTQALVTEIDEEEALQLAVTYALEGGNSDLAVLFLPGIGDALTCEFAAGAGGDDLIGSELVLTTEAARTMNLGVAITSHDILNLVTTPFETENAYGAVCLVPLTAGGTVNGALLLMRSTGRLGYSQENLPLAESFAATVSLAMELERGRQAQSVALTLEERDRIGRDLHDLGIQLLFATGMQLDKLQAEAEEGTMPRRRIAKEIRSAMTNLEDAVQQIRQVVTGLKDSEDRLNFVELLEQEASRSRRVLGFAPSLVLELDGVVLTPDSSAWKGEALELSSRVDEEIAADAIAMVRESVANVARHAGARSVKISATVSGRGAIGELVLSVIDDGRGINPSRTRSSGIANMSNRASDRGGSFAAGLGPRGIGTAVLWRVPLS